MRLCESRRASATGIGADMEGAEVVVDKWWQRDGGGEDGDSDGGDDVDGAWWAADGSEELEQRWRGVGGEGGRGGDA